MSNMLPEVYPSIGDIEQIGVEYSIETNDTNEHEIFSIDVPVGTAMSITVKIAKDSKGVPYHMDYFEKADIFKNESGVVQDRGQLDQVVLRGIHGTPATCYYVIVGTTVKFMVKNGISNQTRWKAIIAVIKV